MTEHTNREEFEQAICRAFFGKTTQELDMNQVEKFLDVRDIVVPLFDQQIAKEREEAEDKILDEKMREIDRMIGDFIKSTWPDGDVLRAREVVKPIDYDPLVRQIRDFARGNAYGNRILDRAIGAADKALAQLSTQKKGDSVGS